MVDQRLLGIVDDIVTKLDRARTDRRGATSAMCKQVVVDRDAPSLGVAGVTRAAVFAGPMIDDARVMRPAVGRIVNRVRDRRPLHGHILSSGP